MAIAGLQFAVFVFRPEIHYRASYKYFNKQNIHKGALQYEKHAEKKDADCTI